MFFLFWIVLAGRRMGFQAVDLAPNLSANEIAAGIADLLFLRYDGSMPKKQTHPGRRGDPVSLAPSRQIRHWRRC
jgi:hypothetical protein